MLKILLICLAISSLASSDETESKESVATTTDDPESVTGYTYGDFVAELFGGCHQSSSESDDGTEKSSVRDRQKRSVNDTSGLAETTKLNDDVVNNTKITNSACQISECPQVEEADDSLPTARQRRDTTVGSMPTQYTQDIAQPEPGSTVSSGTDVPTASGTSDTTELGGCYRPPCHYWLPDICHFNYKFCKDCLTMNTKITIDFEACYWQKMYYYIQQAVRMAFDERCNYCGRRGCNGYCMDCWRRGCCCNYCTNLKNYYYWYYWYYYGYSGHADAPIQFEGSLNTTETMVPYDPNTTYLPPEHVQNGTVGMNYPMPPMEFFQSINGSTLDQSTSIHTV